MLNHSLNNEHTMAPIQMTEPTPECPACDCGMRFIGPKGHCLIWVCRTCGHALIRRIETREEDRSETGSLLFLDELIG